MYTVTHTLTHTTHPCTHHTYMYYVLLWEKGLVYFVDFVDSPLGADFTKMPIKEEVLINKFTVETSCLVA